MVLPLDTKSPPIVFSTGLLTRLNFQKSPSISRHSRVHGRRWIHNDALPILLKPSSLSSLKISPAARNIRPTLLTSRLDPPFSAFFDHSNDLPHLRQNADDGCAGRACGNQLDFPFISKCGRILGIIRERFAAPFSFSRIRERLMFGDPSWRPWIACEHVGEQPTWKIRQW
ncbi:uncharacterized protein B0I36DRAFT_326660 [Microdochium trichocladiopsis]|uniref:Uncharacterized protein n=1 Tax=Microdochium trichocladiopsis TaxID=1682393 RepID=A0A9P9BNB0_9PEZI|nr:uncharacterized protein B0I36DRAFT_326660 [Microdochium trichocladiopsis]KAH7027204.1 hypothetical protein B0I36DRAFT_326660 [Microdochium trichocladiopsis]